MMVGNALILRVQALGKAIDEYLEPYLTIRPRSVIAWEGLPVR